MVKKSCRESWGAGGGKTGSLRVSPTRTSHYAEAIASPRTIAGFRILPRKSRKSATRAGVPGQNSFLPALLSCLAGKSPPSQPAKQHMARDFTEFLGSAGRSCRLGRRRTTGLDPGSANRAWSIRNILQCRPASQLGDNSHLHPHNPASWRGAGCAARRE